MHQSSPWSSKIGTPRSRYMMSGQFVQTFSPVPRSAVEVEPEERRRDDGDPGVERHAQRERGMAQLHELRAYEVGLAERDAERDRRPHRCAGTVRAVSASEGPRDAGRQDECAPKGDEPPCGAGHRHVAEKETSGNTTAH